MHKNYIIPPTRRGRSPRANRTILDSPSLDSEHWMIGPELQRKHQYKWESTTKVRDAWRADRRRNALRANVERGELVVYWTE